ncbi:arsenite efflux transporter metallochaperone ArsD [Companilactobacillus keshanensis]|uniref:Arsenite efflux transporter metallochaperone ArsD n=1 Tax=Companilactobacillus keshanensis TaxID=2486003 RepID=A0ABW4BVP0_9LACO|nr:arsenite efflux transporter metallochaperone ArsD [Companilactobacillus keshanensis]
MKKVQVYEPALCCSTGVCGPSVDQNLITITLIYNKLKDNPDVEFERYNLKSNPRSYINNSMVLTAMHEKEDDDQLPITIVDGKIVKKGEYPTVQEFEEYTGVSLAKVANN